MPDYITQPGFGQQTAQTPAGDPLEEYYRQQQVQQVRTDILAAPAPDAMAKQTALAKQTGTAPADVAGVEGDAERAIRARNMGAVAQAHSAIRAWAVQNPRQSVAASDDHKALGMLGQAWDAIKNSAPSVRSIPFVGDLSNAVSQVGALFGYGPNDLQNAAMHGMAKGVSDIVAGVGALGDIKRKVIGQATGGNMLTSTIMSSVTPGGLLPSMAQVTPGTAMLNNIAATADAAVKSRGLLTKGADMVGGVVPFALSGASAPLVMGLSGAGSQAEAAQQAGKYGTAASDVGILANAGYQAVLGHVFGKLGDVVAPYAGNALGGAVAAAATRATGDSFAGMVGQVAGEKLGGIAARAVSSAMMGGAMQGGANLIEQRTVNLNRSIGEGIGDSALSMVALDLMMHGMHAALGGHDAANGDPTQRLAQTGQSILPDAARAVMGLRDAHILNAIDQSATDSRFKSRDPEGFAELQRYLAQDAGIENVHVPLEAIRAYQQSDHYDAYNDPFAAYGDAIHKAETSGGDVALPAKFVLGELAGTKAFASIRDDIRLRPDGITGAEARHLADNLPTVAKESFDSLTESDRAAAQQRDTRTALVERLTSEIQNAGYTPRNALIMAELVVQRVATRADRLGRTMQPGDFDTRIIRVLPPSVEAARKMDNLDLAINSMRQGKPVETQRGKSLLQFIGERGGINDSGGDLKAMGLADWHMRPARKGVDKNGRPLPPTPIAGRMKLIRDFDPNQASMLGGVGDVGDYGHDSTLRAAIDAGYFPELSGPDYEHNNNLNVDVLHEAISDELSGRPRYAQEAKVDPMRAAGEDLRRMIEAEGHDPSGMSDAEVRKLVEDVASRPVPGGRAFDQALPPKINIDGVDRHTTDSTGRSIARTEEGVRNFWNWFGDSKVVDADGRPLVVYHGTEKAFTRVNLNKGAQGLFWFTSDRASIENGEVSAAGSGAIMDLYAKLDHPADWKQYDQLSLGEFTGRGLDGAVLPNHDGSFDGFIIDRPTQIKSINNRGTFDPADPHILNQSADTLRGRILMPADGWGSGPATIELFHKANLSTLVHELGHQWLEELRFDAAHPEASDQLKGDWASVQKWFADQGHPITDGVIPTDAHELFARGIERYLMEGKAPTKAVTGIFEKIRGWLVNIYRSVNALQSPITPELRQVFDRLIATDDEISAQQKALSMQPAFADPKALGMSDAEAAAYAKLTHGARDEAQSELLGKAMDAERRKATAAWNDERRGVRADETARLEETPLFTALRMMKDTPISKEWIVDRMGEDALGLLPKRVPPMYRDGGAHPDDIAEMAGFDSGEQMLHWLTGAEKAHQDAKASGDARTLRNRIIDHATDTEMARRHGDDPFNDGSIEEKAQTAVNNELAGKLLETELRVLGRKSGNVAALYAIALTWARDKVRRGTISDEASAGAIQGHTRAMAKAGREAEKLILAKKWDAAFAAKQRQMVASALLAEATAARDEVTKASDALAKIAKRKTMKAVDQDYLEQAHALLNDVQLGPRSQKSIDPQGKWADWAAARQAEGYDVVVPATFDATIKGTHWSRLSVENFLGLKDAVDQVMHFGKLKQSLLDGQEQRTWDAVRKEVNDGADMMRQQEAKTISQLHGADIVSNIKSGIYSIDAMLKTMETVVDMMDGGNPNGVWNRVFFQPAAKAEYRSREMIQEWRKASRAIFNDLPKEDAARWMDRVQTPWGPVKFEDGRTVNLTTLNRQEIVSMALNIGNEGNFQRLADGYRINQDSITNFLNETLTPGEWKFVQAMWDKIGSYGPEAFAVERRVNGVAPDKVEARSFDTPHGPMRGGYYPARYDSEINAQARDHNAMDNGLRSANFTPATTRTSSVKERADSVRRPILLDLGVLERHVSEVIHDITHREAVIQMWKIANDPSMSGAVSRTLGPEYAAMLKPWVKGVANSWAMDKAGTEALGKFVNAARSNMTVAALGFNASTVAVHTTMGLFAAGEIGQGWMAHGLWAAMKNPVESARRVIEMSPEVKAIGQHYDQTLRDMISRVAYTGPVDKALSKLHAAAVDARKFSMYGISFIVQRMSIISYIGAHAKALSEGMTESEARYYADKIVRRVAGGHGAKDAPAIMNGEGNWGQVAKLLTQFYTPLKAQYQRQGRFAHNVNGADARDPHNMPELAARAVSLFILPLVMGQAIRMAFGAKGPDKDESWAAWWAKKFMAEQLGPIPVVGSAVEPLWDKVAGHGFRSPNVTPLQRSMDSIAKVATDIGRSAHGKPVKAPIRDTLEAVGYTTGLVPGQVARSTQFMADVADGSQQPGNLQDWAVGMQTGHTPKAGH